MAPTTDEAPRVRSASIGSMSQLLLQGWAMLADCCPDCGVPLMRHPAGDELLCVNCGRDTTAAAGGGAAEPAAPAGAARPAPAAEPQSLPNGPVVSAANGPVSRAANGLAGSMASSDGEEQGGEPEVTAAPPPLRERLRASAGLADVPAAAGGGAGGGQRGDDASKEIAELMLQGWAMLQEHCPRCLNPLLRSRTDRRIYCAACRMYAVHEGQAGAAAAGSTAGQAAQQQQAAARQQAPEAGRAPSGPAAPASVAVPSPAAPTPAAAAALPGAPAEPTLACLPTVDDAMRAVLARLADATSALRLAPPGGASAALVAVQQCAAALQALTECRRALEGLRY